MSLHLFEGLGVELEYAIVDRKTLDVRPVADQLIWTVAGAWGQDVSRGDIAWSNELCLHVIELKTNGPARQLAGVADSFHWNVLEIDATLAAMDCRLLPTAMHPWMNPRREMFLWPHGDKEIYAAYNRIFDCHGHGWSNLQSTHLNFPFSGDEEFGRLHAALRFVMPLLPPLWASSPVMDGHLTPFLDNRLEVYRHNQEALPGLTGAVVPEPVYSKDEYLRLLEKLYEEVRPYDPEGLLQHEWLNSRGAIARFERDTIELRILDIQECPSSDLTMAAALTALLQRLVASPRLAAIAAVPTRDLSAIFERGLTDGPDTSLAEVDYGQLLGLAAPVASVGELWRALGPELAEEIPEEYQQRWLAILRRGPLAGAIRRRLQRDPGSLRAIYEELATCLREDRLFS
jgi:gamma-glutamyl:cysteine ligase YbdK (ATP-grasp superfamily)